jgi:ankyrin repeat protein
VYLSLDVFGNKPASFDGSTTNRQSTPALLHVSRSQNSYRPPEDRFIYYVKGNSHRHIRGCRDNKGLLTEPLLRLLGPGRERAANLIYPRTPSLFIAVRLGKAEVVRGLLKTPKYASRINRRHGESPLLRYAVSYKNISIIQILFEYGADISAGTEWGGTALHFAVSDGSVEIVQLLLDNGADISASNEKGYTALHLAVYRGFIEIVQLLLDNGADTSAQTSTDGNTALHLAVALADVEKTRFLLENGADVSTRNNAGRTSLDLVTLYIIKASMAAIGHEYEYVNTITVLYSA